jgi:hypothetical protein
MGCKVSAEGSTRGQSEPQHAPPLHPRLTGLRTRLGPAERDAHDAGQVSILRALHDRLDAAVAAAYGWPHGLPEAEIVARVVALNAERVAEEAAGTVRWLRPEFQAPDEARRRAGAAAAIQIGMPVAEPAPAAPSADAWPKEAPAQFILLRAARSSPGCSKPSPPLAKPTRWTAAASPPEPPGRAGRRAPPGPAPSAALAAGRPCV